MKTQPFILKKENLEANREERQQAFLYQQPLQDCVFFWEPTPLVQVFLHSLKFIFFNFNQHSHQKPETDERNLWLID